MVQEMTQVHQDLTQRENRICELEHTLLMRDKEIQIMTELNAKIREITIELARQLEYYVWSHQDVDEYSEKLAQQARLLTGTKASYPG